ncbi:GTPase Era [Atopobacter phocae]|uniref:GTPase Era n=1 Tax=Atopobacter phocae TaxID=136492 RepID=UPI00047000E9|nr:GTPase Era [Atopobacter phocae]
MSTLKTKKEFHSGFAAIVGRPNVGKSTLMNQMLGQKVAIMSDTAQTTRNKIQGVYTDDDAQIIFIDTPGIHKPKHELGEFMNKSAYSSLKEVDMVCLVINGNEKLGPGDKFIIEKLSQIKTPIFLLLNKIDLMTPEEVFDTVEEYRHLLNFKEIIPISALNGANLSTFLDLLKKNLPVGPMYYPKDQVTDHPERFVVSEFIREKIFLMTRDEVPHSVAVQVESMKTDSKDVVHIEATIMIDRDSQKGIIIGKGGKMLKQIGTAARKDIEQLLGNRVFLDLWVKVKPKWRDQKSTLENLGYSQKDYN